MTLDPVHVDGIATLAGAIASGVDDSEYEGFAETVWEEWLDPLRRSGRTVLEPLGERRRRVVPVENAALTESPFPTVHGLDSGTINPTTFKNGLVLDVAQAAMASVPTDLDLHRSRSLVATVHSNDTTAHFPEEWVRYDDGYSRRRVLKAPRVNRFAEGVVHALALYLAESSHALVNANAVTDLLVLDGPVYPKELLTWRDRETALEELAHEATPQGVIENYVRLVERFVGKEVPLLGFVKNPATTLITDVVRERGGDAPWVDDAGLFARLLEDRTDGADGRSEGEAEGDRDRPAPDDGRRTDRLTFTSWFRSRGGVDRTFAADGDGLGVDRRLDPELYEVTFFALYDPRRDLVYRVEAPYAFTRDPETRRRVTAQVLHDVATARGPPPAVAKADELARIDAREKAALRRRLETELDAESVERYDDHRWGPGER